MAILRCFIELELLKIVSAFFQFLTNGGWRFFNSEFLVDSGGDKTLTLVFEIIKLGFIPKCVFHVVLKKLAYC